MGTPTLLVPSFEARWAAAEWAEMPEILFRSEGTTPKITFQISPLATLRASDKIAQPANFSTMADNNIFLIRKTGGLWTKYSNVQSVVLTGQPAAYGGVTGVATTDVITVPGVTLVNGYQITFLNLSGGSGIAQGQSYYIINASGSTCKISITQGGAAVNFTTNITAGTALITTTEMRIWSAEYRDTFTPTGTTYTQQIALIGVPTASDYQVSDTTTDPFSNPTFEIRQSDEINHWPLRQTLLNHTFWQFNITGQTPTTLYADFLPGDIISNNQPQTA